MAIGAALAIGVAVAQTGLADIASLLALAWIVVVSIGLLRHPERGNDGALSGSAVHPPCARMPG